MVLGLVGCYRRKQRQRRSSIWMVALLGTCLFSAGGGRAVAELCTSMKNTGLPVVRIGHKVEPETEWKLDASRTIMPGTTITFQAMEVYDPNLPPRELQSYIDWDGDIFECWEYPESITCPWWWHYEGPSDTPDAEGRRVSKTFNKAGTRSVRLECVDQAIWIDDDNTSAGMSVTVPLTMELDTMSGCNHTIPTSGLAAAWEQVGYVLDVNPNQDTDCDYYEFLGHYAFYQRRAFYLKYDDPDIDTILYLMGVHRWSEWDPILEKGDYSGMTDVQWSVVCCCSHNGLSDTMRQSAAIHEHACHFPDAVGMIGHCWSADMGCAAHDDSAVSSLAFCQDPLHPDWGDYCLHKLRTYLRNNLNN